MIAQVHGEGTPLVVIHGFGVDHRILLPLEDMPQGQAWKRIYLDLPWAEGADDTGEQTPRELADAVLAEVQEIVGEGDFAVVGNSFGAIIARHIAHTLRSQCLGLATLAGVFQADHALRRLPEHRVTLHDADVLERAGDAREEFAAIAVVHTSETLERFQRFVLPGLRGANQEVLERLGARYTQAPAPEADTDDPFEAPSLHVFGRQDQVVGFEDGLALRDHYTRGSFVVLDAAGHNVHLEQTEVVGALVRDWLDRVDTARRVTSAQLLGVE
ncbi:alpha/beta hydrolase [Nocardiopsis exhalans]|uniref:Alpha/beta hydrolase n=1 Tax=Nocardiopsis exhalans TaxID=163604 RepID=A0ABY5DGJ6_9ACTN|nr:alpha/beta hydrolase [Nocardiopsis exhalans]USY23085.1 alpha/beta hydrolase [Nocardiopsis exhalans]